MIMSSESSHVIVFIKSIFYYFSVLVLLTKMGIWKLNIKKCNLILAPVVKQVAYASPAYTKTVAAPAYAPALNQYAAYPAQAYTAPAYTPALNYAHAPVVAKTVAAYPAQAVVSNPISYAPAYESVYAGPAATVVKAAVQPAVLKTVIAKQEEAYVSTPIKNYCYLFRYIIAKS